MDFQKLLGATKSNGVLSKHIAPGPSRGQVSLTVPEAEVVPTPAESKRLASSQPTS